MITLQNVLVHNLLLADTLWIVPTTTAREIRTEIESRIATGDLQAGDRLPAVRTYADDLGVSPATVSAAYRDLRLRGMVTGRGRQGTLVAPTQRATAATTTLSTTVPSDLIDAVNGSPDPALLPPLDASISFAMSQPTVAYGSPVVAPALAAAATRLFEADQIDAEHLTVTAGAMDAIERVLGALDLRIGDRIGVEDPGHAPVHQIARRLGLELVPLPVDPHGITVAGLRDALADGLAALVVTPRAQNPTGAAFTAARAEELSAILAEHPATALIQDDHAGLIAGVDYHPLATPGPRWAVMRSLGKSFGPDLRVALLVGDEQTLHRVSSGFSNGPGWVSFMLQRMAAFLLDDDATRALLAKASASYADRRAQLIGRLAEHGIEATGASGLNVWIPSNDDHVLVEAARDAGCAIRTATPYQLRSPRAVRVTVSLLSSTNIDNLADALGAAARGPHHAPAM